MTASAVEPCIIALFAKAPLAGSVKTRLIPTLGAQGAAALHANLVVQALEVARAAEVGRVELWCTSGGQDFFERLALEYGVDLHPQSPGDLGQRMCEAVRHSLSRARAAIVIGSDCPARTPQDLREAARALAQPVEVVLGPVEDGGYHLIGMRTLQTQLLERIDWGSDRVLQQTRQRLRELRLRCEELPVRWDVDRPDDVGRLLADPALSLLAADLRVSAAAP